MVRDFRKKYITLFFVLILPVMIICAEQGQELFLRANKYYLAKDYDNALTTYDLIKEKGSAVLYNMGNCYFNKQEYSYALLYWSRAELGATNEEYIRIQHNKKRALQALGRQSEQKWWVQIAQDVQSKLPEISLFFLQLFFLISWFLFLLAISKKQTGYKKTAQGMAFLGVFVFAVILGVHYNNTNMHSAIVVKKDAKLFSGPDKSLAVLSPVLYAEQASVKEARAGWYKVQYADMIGWVESDVIQII